MNRLRWARGPGLRLRGEGVRAADPALGLPGLGRLAGGSVADTRHPEKGPPRVGVDYGEDPGAVALGQPERARRSDVARGAKRPDSLLAVEPSRGASVDRGERGGGHDPNDATALHSRATDRGFEAARHLGAPAGSERSGT